VIIQSSDKYKHWSQTIVEEHKQDLQTIKKEFIKARIKDKAKKFDAFQKFENDQ